MAQADSVPSPTRTSITGASATASTDRRSEDQRSFTGRPMGDHETAPRGLWPEKRDEDLNPSRYEATNGRMPLRWYMWLSVTRPL
jgi:hypothetical protein